MDRDGMASDRQLRGALRDARHATGMTPDAVAEALGWPVLVLLRAEQSPDPAARVEAEVLLGFYASRSVVAAGSGGEEGP